MKTITLSVTLEVEELPPWGPTPLDSFYSAAALVGQAVITGDRPFQFNLRVEGLTPEEQAAMEIPK